MDQVTRVLFPTDFSRCAGQALAWALLFARRWGAELYIFHAVLLHDDDPHNPAYHFPDSGEMVAILQRLAATRVSADLDGHEVQGLTVRQAHERAAAPAPAILEYAAANGIDVIVMGSHGRRGLGRLLIGSVAEEVIRRAPCPVLTVREKDDDDATKAAAPGRILVPVDFSDHSARSVASGKWLAEAFAAELWLLHVVEEQVHPSFYAIGKTSILEIQPEIRGISTAEMMRIYEAAPGKKAVVATHVVEGRPGAEIVDFAGANGIDVIVTGTRGLTGVEHALLGSVAERVVRSAPCPVLVVK